ncbi:MAG: type VI secretion system lipoprotein TssJ [Candidatus Latescibacteria bacterium]|nr:type VI secretion system lipoprotein TssJ [Candidatus Latescibacterota bacterium]
MINVRISLITLLLPTLFFCSQKPDPTPVWSYEPQGITVHYKADALLNAFNSEPHTVVLLVFQLTSIDAFNRLVKTEDGLKKLLQGENFDASVVNMDKIIVQPGESDSFVLNRAENARWIGIVAGYYELIPGFVNHSFKIPFEIDETGRFWKKKKHALIQQLNINLILGTRAIQKAGTL